MLVDGSAGGLGEAFDWGALTGWRAFCAKPLILAGGLTPENVGDAIGAVRPYAVDVSSGVERSRGIKDERLIAAFCESVRSADAASGGRQPTKAPQAPAIGSNEAPDRTSSETS